MHCGKARLVYTSYVAVTGISASVTLGAPDGYNGMSNAMLTATVTVTYTPANATTHPVIASFDPGGNICKSTVFIKSSGNGSVTATLIGCVTTYNVMSGWLTLATISAEGTMKYRVQFYLSYGKWGVYGGRNTRIVDA